MKYIHYISSIFPLFFCCSGQCRSLASLQFQCQWSFGLSSDQSIIDYLFSARKNFSFVRYFVHQKSHIVLAFLRFISMLGFSCGSTAETIPLENRNNKKSFIIYHTVIDHSNGLFASNDLFFLLFVASFYSSLRLSEVFAVK